MVADVNQRNRLVGREVGGGSEFHLHRVDQGTSDAAARPVRPSATVVPGEHGREYVVGPGAADHVRDERVSGNQAHVVRHLRRQGEIVT